jgi:hypothetical protein
VEVEMRISRVESDPGKGKIEEKTMKMKRFLPLLAVFQVSFSAWGILPEPDALFYGTVTIDEMVVTGGVRVIARVDGVPDPVGTFIYGACVGSPSLTCPPSDKYLLSVRMESLADGDVVNGGVDAARIGQTVKIYLQQGTDPEVLAASVPLDERGMVQELDLTPGGGGGGDEPLFDAASDWYNGLLPEGLLGLIETLKMDNP